MTLRGLRCSQRPGVNDRRCFEKGETRGDVELLDENRRGCDVASERDGFQIAGALEGA